MNYLQLQQVFYNCGIPHDYIKPILKVLYQSELAVPLDNDMLLLPSTLQRNPQNKLCSTVKYNFPGMDVPMPKNMSSGAIDLRPTGLCYRRLFVANYISEKFWFRLIPQFASSAEIYYKILLNNCVEGMTLEKMANIGDAVIGNHHCKCLYWKNSITLLFDDKVLFCINGLMQCEDTSKAHRAPTTVTIGNIKAAQLVDANMKKQMFPKDGDGFEVIVHDYVVQSNLNGETRTSCKLGPRILAQVLEILNELCIAFSKGDIDKGIYSQRFLHQVVVCPYCYGDPPVAADGCEIIEPQVLESSLHSLYKKYINSVNNYEIKQFENAGGYGFDIQDCILEAQNHGFVFCPNHERLNLLHLTPDLVSLCILYILICMYT